MVGQTVSFRDINLIYCTLLNQSEKVLDNIHPYQIQDLTLNYNHSINAERGTLSGKKFSSGGETNGPTGKVDPGEENECLPINP